MRDCSEKNVPSHGCHVITSIVQRKGKNDAKVVKRRIIAAQSVREIIGLRTNLNVETLGSKRNNDGLNV